MPLPFDEVQKTSPPTFSLVQTVVPSFSPSEVGSMMGQPTKSRTTVTRKSPKEFTVVTELENTGSSQKLGEDHCRKK